MQNFIEDFNIPRNMKSYLGDGLYAVKVDYGIWIQSYNGIEILNSVFLDEIVYANLVRFHGEK